MTIAELFVNLGIKGTDKTVGALGSVKKGLGETASMSLEAKAGILAAMYALERLFATSGQVGTGLTNFNALTGDSVQMLQKLQFAGRQVGLSNQETASSFMAVKNAMTNMLLGKGAPEGMAMLANKVGFDPKRARDTMYVWQQLQKFAQSVPQDVGNTMLKSFGLSEGAIAGMRRNAFTPEIMAKAPTYSDREIGALDKANIAWSNLGTKIEMAVGHFNARHGLQLVNDISKVTTEVIKLVEALTKLAERLKIFQFIGKAFEGWNMIFEKINGGVDSLGKVKSGKDAKALGSDVLTFFKDMPKVFKAAVEDMLDVEGAPAKIEVGRHIAPNVSPTQGGASTHNVEVNQTLQFNHDGQDHKKNADSHRKAIKDAYRQLQSQVQGS